MENNLLRHTYRNSQVPLFGASAMLEISYWEYEFVVMPIGSRTDFNITMHESAAEIEQVVYYNS